jgi:metallophosphoesterase superfamily enzyme
VKIFVDLEDPNGPIANALKQVFQTNIVGTASDADVVVVDSVQSVLRYLHNDECVRKVVQFCWGHHHPMHHLVEDYPNRFRVALFSDKGSTGLVSLCNAFRELQDRQ